MGYMQKVTTSDLAAILGITERRIGHLVVKKILKRESRGTFDLVDSIQAFIAHREAVVSAQHGVGAYGKARADLYRERAKMARLQREKLEGELIAKVDIIAMNTAIATVVKTKILAIGSKIAPRLVMIPTPAQIESLLRAEHVDALEELSQLGVVPAGDGSRNALARRRRHKGGTDASAEDDDDE
jgi:phage terminase Nu1 subunit (DNA packaging protein)